MLTRAIKSMILVGAIMAALLVAACTVPTPEPTATPIPDVIPTPRIADTPTQPSVSTPTPRALSLPGGGSYNQYARPPLMTIDATASYSAIIRTNQGSMTIELFPSEAPKTVNNFVFLAQEGFYNGLIFHRVIPRFMIQGGDPTGNGTSGPGYKFEDEIVDTLGFEGPGILAMANAGPGTNGSQFFITVAPTPHLQGNHTIFGRIVDGQSVADAISVVTKGPGDRPVQPVVIEAIDIVGP